MTPILSGLDYPASITFGPDGDLYVTNNGFSLVSDGNGAILRIESRINGGIQMARSLSLALPPTARSSTAVESSEPGILLPDCWLARNAMSRL